MVKYLLIVSVGVSVWFLLALYSIFPPYGVLAMPLASSTLASTLDTSSAVSALERSPSAGRVSLELNSATWQRIRTQIEQDGMIVRLPLVSQTTSRLPQTEVQASNELAKLAATDAQTGAHFGFSVAVDGDTVLVGADGANNGAGAAYVFSRNQGGHNAWGQVAKLTAADAQANDGLGVAVALDGDIALVGSRQVQEAGDLGDPPPEAGAAYIFMRNPGGADAWRQVAKLTAADGHAGDYFGLAVALDGETALVGAYQADGGIDNAGTLAGAAYIFMRNHGGNDAWGQVAKLTASDAQKLDYFGYDVALDGDTALIGAMFEDGGEGDPTDLAGAAYVFSRHHEGADAWGQVAKLSAADAQELDHFGYAVALDGEIALVSALYEAGGAGDPVPNAGAAYIFMRNHAGNDAWGQVTKLSASDLKSNAGFGMTVALDGETALIGAYAADGDVGSAGDVVSRAGAVYMYRNEEGGADAWGQTTKLTAVDAQTLDGFGVAVALDGETALIGAFGEAGGPGDPMPEAGAAYLYQRAPSP